MHFSCEMKMLLLLSKLFSFLDWVGVLRVTFIMSRMYNAVEIRKYMN